MFDQPPKPSPRRTPTSSVSVSSNRPNAALAYVRPLPTTELHGVIDPARPETNPEKRHQVAHELEGAREIALLFRDNPSVLVILSPTEMVFRSDWEKSK